MGSKNTKAISLLRSLKKYYPNPECALTHNSPLQLVVATILSAQCTDVRVNLVTPALFKKYKSVDDFANSSPVELEALIRSTGFYRNKAKSIRGMAKMLIEKHKGQVPDTMNELLELPGVARKTANVVLGTAFGRAEGVVVDTHVRRLSNRLGFTNKSQPEKIEQDLIKKIPQKDWIWFSHALINHGRSYCKARNPECFHCPLKKDCPYPAKTRHA
jgi:endonuclease-3